MGVLAQFHDFIRQVPETLVDQRCKKLLSSFCTSQRGSRYAMWVNSNRLFMRVKVVDIVDALSAYPRVRIHVRDDEFAIANFAELFHDKPEIQ
jgi:hypothetical protein